MIGSVDSTSFVKSFPKLTNDDIAKLDFFKKRDKFGSWVWFDNGIREVFEPQITFYKTWGGIMRQRVDVNFAKLFHGSNIHLPTLDEIQDGLLLTQNNIYERTGLKYEISRAEMCRVHYALNKRYEFGELKKVIGRYANYRIPRMKRTVIEDETVYFENKSRGIRIYDKNAEILNHNPLPELLLESENIVRFEYFIDGLTNVKRFSKRLGFRDATAQILLSETSIEAAISELKALLSIDSIEIQRKSDLEQIFQATGNINLAIDISGFKDAIKSFGKEFYKDDKYKMSKQTYYRRLGLCQKYGF